VGGNKRDAEAGDHSLLDGLVGTELHPYLNRLDRRVADEAVE
jgi:hypothetical protein